MTSIWGPLGWMTLHSVSSCYPDSPLPAESTLMQTWLDMFQGTITCPSCKEHFGTALLGYRRLYPTMVSSRREFMLAVFRIHNTVNRRLNKPIYPSVAACFEQLRTNVKTRSARDYRIAYLNHIRRYWRTMQDASGFTALKKLNEMSKIEIDHFLGQCQSQMNHIHLLDHPLPSMLQMAVTSMQQCMLRQWPIPQCKRTLDTRGTRA